MFDSKKFLKTKFTPRTADVPVPDLREFFSDGTPAVWKVRGLTGHELGRAAEAAERNKSVLAIIEGRFEMHAPEPGLAPREHVVVERFIVLRPGETCAADAPSRATLTVKPSRVRPTVRRPERQQAYCPAPRSRLEPSAPDRPAGGFRAASSGRSSVPAARSRSFATAGA